MKRIIGTTVVATLVMTGAAVGTANAASAQTIKFGSMLNSTIQPSNSTPAHPCDQTYPNWNCTWVMNEAYGRPNGGERAPRRGTLRKVRVISGATGNFRLQLVKARKVNGVWQGKLMANGPKLHLKGQTDANYDTDHYKVETFKVNMPIRRGWRLAMKATKSSALRCSSGGDNTLLFYPPLSAGGYRNATSDDGCWPLIEGVIRY